jgi:hypothetical protein
MVLDELIYRLQEIRKQHGGNLEVVYSKDDEGNAFHEVVYSPTVGYHLAGTDEWVSEGEFAEFFDEPPKINAVCIN